MSKIDTVLFGSLALIPQIAEIPITETLTFLTDSIVSYDGTEQNIQLRNKPRQSFQYSIPFDPRSDANIWNTAYGAIRKKWAVPVWHDAQFVGTVNAGLSFINCDTVNYDLRASSLAMLYTTCGKYQIFETSTITTTRINVTTNTTAFANAYLIPIRVGYANGSIARNTSGYAGKVAISFDVIDTLLYSPAAPAQYLSNDIYYQPGLLSGAFIDTVFDQDEQSMDFDVGPFERRTPWIRSKYGKTYRTSMVTPAERTAYRDFIYRRIGKVRPFWLPTFENNLRCKNTSLVTTTLIVSKDANPDYAVDRTHIAIETNTGWFPFAISAPTSIDPDTMQFTLSASLNALPQNIRRISYLGLNRLNSDSVDFTYDSALVANSAVRVIEINV